VTESSVADPTFAMLSLAGTVLASSLLGSAHCAGMCGGVALVAIGADGTSRFARQLGYHIGRLIAYMMVGVACGLVGRVIDDAGTLVGLQRIASMVAGLMIAAFGLMAILRTFGAPLPVAQVPRPLIALAQRAHVRTMKLPPAWRGVPLGLATPLLPCGWLYAFAAIAAGSASAAMGALILAAFWLGTVPALVIASNGARMAFAKLGRLAPVMAGLAMLIIGVHAACWRSTVAEQALASLSMRRVTDDRTAAPVCADLSREVTSVASEIPACCRARTEQETLQEKRRKLQLVEVCNE